MHEEEPPIAGKLFHHIRTRWHYNVYLFFVLEAEGKIEEDKRALFLTYKKIRRAKYLANNISTKRGRFWGFFCCSCVLSHKKLRVCLCVFVRGEFNFV
jgi:hypothetical protein